MTTVSEDLTLGLGLISVDLKRRCVDVSMSGKSPSPSFFIVSPWKNLTRR